MKHKLAKTKGLPKLLEKLRCKLNKESVIGHGFAPVLRIEAGKDAPAPSPRGCKVFLDGHDITNGLRGLQFHLELDEPLHVHLDIIVRPDIPDVLLEYLVGDKILDPLDVIKKKKRSQNAN